MPIPSAISDLSTTPALNSPAGSESPALVDDYLRTHAAFIKQVNDESVKTSGNQTIAGTKTFSSAPTVPDNSFTLSKLQTVATGTILGRSSAGTGVVESLTTLPALNGSALTNLNGANISSGDIAAARITNALNASGSAPIYACRAWVNFNGTGTVAIRASGNVSSITDNGTGDYTVNFTTAMPDTNYAFSGGLAGGSSSAQIGLAESVSTTRTASLVRIYTGVPAATNTDFPTVMLCIFR